MNNNDDVPEKDTTLNTENIEAVKKIILNNRRITIREVADNVSISFISWQAIFMDVFSLKRAAVKIFPNC